MNCCVNPKGCCDCMVYLLAFVTAVIIIVTAYENSVSFSDTIGWHIVFMSLGVPFLLVCGRWIHQSEPMCMASPMGGKGFGKKGFGDFFGMGGKGGKDKMPPPDPAVVKSCQMRAHGIVMSVGAFCILMGYVMIAIYHGELDIFFGYDFDSGSWLSDIEVIHAWCGYVILILVAVQVIVGLQKYWAFHQGFEIRTFHPILGKIIIAFAFLQVIFGMSAVGFDATAIVLISVACDFGLSRSSIPFPISFFSLQNVWGGRTFWSWRWTRIWSC